MRKYWNTLVLAAAVALSILPKGAAAQPPPQPVGATPIEVTPRQMNVAEHHVVWDGDPACDEACAACPSAPDCASCGDCPPPEWCIHDPWVRAEVLIGWTDGLSVPALVTTSPAGTRLNNAGVLGRRGTEILVGDEDLFEDDRLGGRVRFGAWLDPCHTLGVEGEYFGLKEDTFDFAANCGGDGLPILARPFFNVNPRDPNTGNPGPPARNDSELVCFPDVLQGEVGVEASTTLDSAAARLRWRLCCDRANCCATQCMYCERSCSFDLLFGYRHLRLRDRLAITEVLASLIDDAPGTFNIFERFDTRNEFHGGEIGLLWEQRSGAWSLELLGRVGLGNTSQTVTIDGATLARSQGQTNFGVGGLLAQRTNIGTHEADEFSVVPELGVTLGYQLTRTVRATFGYTLVYWTNVARAGDQIDLRVNPDLLPPEADPFTGPLVPAFAFQESDFWMQAVSFGLDWRF